MWSLTSLVEFYSRNTRILMVLAVIFTLVSGGVASNLELEADLERLLPDSAPSVQGMRALQKAYGPIGRLTLVLQGEEPEQLEAAADALGAAATQIPRVKRSEFKKPTAFFEAKRLLYIEHDDLAEASKRIKKRLRWEKQRANPLFASLSDDAPSVDLSDIEAKYDAVGQSPYFHNVDHKKVLVFLYFDFGPGDLGQSKKSIRKVETWANALLAKDFPGVKMELTGRYKKRIDQTDMLEADLGVATTLAFVLLIMFLLAYFRSFAAPILVVVPLLMGTVWAFAWAQLVFGTLNILTGFFGAVILGLGIDYGIHLMSRYLEARRGGEALQQAIVTTLASAGRASMFAGITTVVAFGSLAVSHFRAFHEYGIIALGGMTLIIIAQIVVLPLLLMMVAGTPFEPRLVEPKARWSKTKISPKVRITMVAMVVVLCAVAGSMIESLGFEYDFQKVFSTDLPSWHLDEEVDEILELPQIPAVILADNAAHANAIARELRRRTEEVEEGKTIRVTMTILDALPKRQTEKIEILQDLKNRFDKLPQRVKLDDDKLKSFRAEIDRVLAAGALGKDDLPSSIREPFERIDSKDATTVLAFPAIELHDAREMAEFATVIRGLPGPTEGTTVDAISESLLMVDILEFVRVDGLFMVLITLIGLLITAFVAFRKPRRIVILLGTLGASVFVALGLVAAFDIQFNFVNILILPIWLGLGVDAAFHLMVRAEESPGDLDGFARTIGAVSAAFGTSMIGFGSMMITNHNGLSSLGAVAVVGLGSILMVSALIQAILFLRSEE